MFPGVISFTMKSWPSKITTGMAAFGVCGLLNSCQLGAGKYSSQTEIEADVPESLEQGKPSEGPPQGPSSYAGNQGVPSNSNLLETTEAFPPNLNSTAFNGDTSTGGAPIPSNPADPALNLIDIPKPDFASVSVHSPRPPANMIKLDSTQAAARMSLPPGPRPGSAVASETVQPLPPVSPSAETSPAAPSDAEIASAPKASPAETVESITPLEPGVPLLHSTASLSDFYAQLHQPLFDHTVVENTAPPAEAAPEPVDTELPPPPPPGETAFGSPAPQ